jgi:hypothetical protein
MEVNTIATLNLMAGVQVTFRPHIKFDQLVLSWSLFQASLKQALLRPNLPPLLIFVPNSLNSPNSSWFS